MHLATHLIPKPVRLTQKPPAIILIALPESALAIFRTDYANQSCSNTRK